MSHSEFRAAEQLIVHHRIYLEICLRNIVSNKTARHNKTSDIENILQEFLITLVRKCPEIFSSNWESVGNKCILQNAFGLFSKCTGAIFSVLSIYFINAIFNKLTST